MDEAVPLGMTLLWVDWTCTVTVGLSAPSGKPLWNSSVSAAAACASPAHGTSLCHTLTALQYQGAEELLFEAEND